MAQRIVTAVICMLACIAFCEPVSANSLEKIDNPLLKNYSQSQLDRGAPSLLVSSRVLYGEALKLLKAGDWERAQEKLVLSGSLSGDYPDPMFTLARLELLHGHPDFLFHLLEGFKRLCGSFNRQSLLALNLSFHLVTAAIISLLLILIVLLLRYWQLLNHKIHEVYSRKYSFPPQKFVGVLIILAFAIMRLGVAAYMALLIISLWAFMSKKERTSVSLLVVFIGVASVMAPFSNILVPAIDEGSITRRLSMINTSGSGPVLIDSIRKIEDPQFEAEKEFALGTLMYRLGNYEKARDHLLASVSLRNNFAPAFLNLGNVYFMQADYNKALAGYQSVLAIDSTNAIAHFNIGQAYINKMLFAQSSLALKNASSHGIEQYRKDHPATSLRKLSVYEECFPPKTLWSVAEREARSRKNILFGEILVPWLLFPFRWLGYLLAASILTGMIISSRMPGTWRISKCDNCGRATCPVCSSNETGLLLCQDCSGVISGLSSIKVMEALLRHRRQKVYSTRNIKAGWKTALIPGTAHIWHGKTISGMAWMLIDFSAILALVWSGFYFKDPRVLSTPSPLWKIIIPAVILLFGFLSDLKINSPQEQRNFRVLPADFIPETSAPEEEKKKPEPARAGTMAENEKFETFLDSL